MKKELKVFQPKQLKDWEFGVHSREYDKISRMAVRTFFKNVELCAILRDSGVISIYEGENCADILRVDFFNILENGLTMGLFSGNDFPLIQKRLEKALQLIKKYTDLESEI